MHRLAGPFNIDSAFFLTRSLRLAVATAGTRGFDPTLRPDGDQIPGQKNDFLHELLAGTYKPANVVFANKSGEVIAPARAHYAPYF